MIWLGLYSVQFVKVMEEDFAGVASNWKNNAVMTFASLCLQSFELLLLDQYFSASLLLPIVLDADCSEEESQRR